MNGLKQFENSLTRQAELSLDYWTKELANMSDSLKNDPMAVIKELNDRSKLCTPGFLIRRQIQTAYPDLLQMAADETAESYPDLFKSNNLPWPEALLKNLGLKLEKHMLQGQKQVVKAKEWIKWMNDSSVPTKRELAIKLSFLLDMDDSSSTKFLLACGHEPFSVRNPLDCICLFCKLVYTRNDWAKVEELLTEYEEKRPDEEGPVTTKTATGTIGMTEQIRQTLQSFSESGVPESEKKILEQDLLQYMFSQDQEFTRRKILVKKNKETGTKTAKKSVYASGYSLSRRSLLLDLTRYLAKLYPTYDREAYQGGDRRNTRDDMAETLSMDVAPVRVDESGFPNLTDLSRAFICSHGWEFVEPSELNLSSYGSVKNAHDNIAFNRQIYLFCKSYEKNNRLGAIERFLLYPDHAETVERKDILLLAYLFISGYSRIEEEDLKEELYDMAEAPQGESLYLQNIIDQLDDIADMWDEDQKIKGYISCMNAFLLHFSFEPLYPPFILDRFFLYALVGEEIGTPGLAEDGRAENLCDLWLTTGYTEYEESNKD